ncbi:MAG: phosphatase PAP2 family protein [Gemmatimonadetes bacterium]|nr:phosphatase PAP2 family protein [Gemmatimonadota bacterium]
MNAIKLALGSYDERILIAFLTRRRHTADIFMRLVTKLGNAAVIIPITLSTAFGLVPGPSELATAGRLAAWSLAISHLLAQILKRMVGRKRPDLPAGLDRLIVPEDRFSFPSGHATAGLSVALPVMLVLSWPIAAVVLGVGVLIGISRCYLGVHYPGDVLVGWALATCTVFSVQGVLL